MCLQSSCCLSDRSFSGGSDLSFDVDSFFNEAFFSRSSAGLDNVFGFSNAFAGSVFGGIHALVEVITDSIFSGLNVLVNNIIVGGNVPVVDKGGSIGNR